ncbi:MAG: DUF4190 domain-containing protein [Lachnospiraceae bacterium]|nr:DUF4190 domain-containing protein [Lachnospiraceae bacterium]
MNEDQFKYQQPYPQYQQPVKPPKGDGIGFGVASLVLGAVSILMFGCCVNYILVIIAIALGIVQLVKNKQKGLAIGGIVTACVSILLGTLLWIGVFANAGEWNTDNLYKDFYEDFYEEYEDEYLPLYNDIDEL